MRLVLLLCWCLLVVAVNTAWAQGVALWASGSGFLSAIPAEKNKYSSGSRWVSCDGYSKTPANSYYCNDRAGYWCEYQNTNLCSPKYSARCGTSSVWCNLDFLCPGTPSDITCPPKDYPNQCKLVPSVYCPVDTDCIRRSDDALVCELQDNITSIVPALLSQVKCGKVSPIDSSAITSSSYERKIEVALKYSYHQSLALPAPICSNQMRIVNQYEFDAPQTGNYTISFASACINAALSVSSLVDSCDTADDSLQDGSSAVCLGQGQQTNVSLKRGAKLLLQFGAAYGLRCFPNADINIIAVYSPSQVQMLAPLYLYISIPVFAVLAILMGFFGMYRNGLIGVWMCSACEISGILVYLTVADFDRPEIFVAMLAFLFVPFVCSFVSGLSYLTEYAGTLNKVAVMIPKPSIDLRLSFRVNYPDDHELNELADYVSVVVVVLSRIVSRLAILMLGSILWILWLAVQIVFAIGTMSCIFICYVFVVIFVVYIKGIVFLYPQTKWAEEREVEIINVVILGDLFVRTLPQLIMVIFNGAATGQTGTVIFIYAVFGASLTIANTMFALVVLFRRSGSMSMLQYDRFHLRPKCVDQSSPAPKNSQTPSKSSQDNVRGVHFDSYYPNQQEQKSIHIAQGTSLPNSNGLESKHESTMCVV